MTNYEIFFNDKLYVTSFLLGKTNSHGPKVLFAKNYNISNNCLSYKWVPVQRRQASTSSAPARTGGCNGQNDSLVSRQYVLSST
jgi:hypothetical protein